MENTRAATHRLLCLLLVFLTPLAVSAQCSMCRDSTAGSAPAMRAGLRVAIPVLGIPALLLFAAFLVIAWRSDKKSDLASAIDEPKAGKR